MERRSFILLAGSSFIPITGCISHSEGDSPSTDNRQASPTTAPTASPTARPTEVATTEKETPDDDTTEEILPPTSGSTEKETTDDDTAEGDISPTARPTETNPTATLPPRLEIHYSGEKEIELKIVLTDLSTKKNVYTEQHTVKNSEVIDLTKNLTDGNGYKIVIEMNGNRIYNRNMYDYENYVLSVHPDGSVRMKQHVAV